MHPDIKTYIEKLLPEDQRIARLLHDTIAKALPEAASKVWHAHPVWFLDGNPIVGFSRLKNSVRLLFWSGQSFGESGLHPEGSFKAAEARYTHFDQIVVTDLNQWLAKARDIRWDYKNIVKRKGVLIRL